MDKFFRKHYSHDYILNNLSFDPSPEVDKALNDCARSRKNNQDFLDKYLDSITTFICQNSDATAGCSKNYLK